MNRIPEHLRHFFVKPEVIEELRRETWMAQTKEPLTPEIRQQRIDRLRQSMRENGIRAEENFFTCLLYRMRDNEDE